MNIKKTITTSLLISSALILSSTSYAAQNKFGRESGRGSEGSPVIYVTSQGLYYDSIALTNLPPKGDFQQLIPGMYGLETEFGPGDVGHLGGRWWVDINPNGEMDSEDMYFLCPLLGPGRENM